MAYHCDCREKRYSFWPSGVTQLTSEIEACTSLRFQLPSLSDPIVTVAPAGENRST